MAHFRMSEDRQRMTCHGCGQTFELAELETLEHDCPSEAPEGFTVGEKLYGFCNGYFGRDSYETKTVEAAGHDWVVCRDEDGCVHFATFDSTKPSYTTYPPTKPHHTRTFWQMVKEWRNPDQYG